MRLFVGIPLAATVVAELAATTAGMKHGADGLRWSAPEGWHITLQFLGNTTKEQYACVTAALSAVRAARVPLQVGELGFFDRAGVFFADVVPTRELAGLQKAVVTANEACGFVEEARPYHPHITLARIQRSGGRNGGGRDELKRLKERVKQQSKCSSFVATEFVLYESVTGPDGARYEVRERFGLN